MPADAGNRAEAHRDPFPRRCIAQCTAGLALLLIKDLEVPADSLGAEV